MASIKRRINSTGRKRITREHVRVDLLDTKPGAPAQATVKLVLSDLNLAPDAALVIEPYYRSSSMRFECGTVGRPEIPEILELTEIDSDGDIKFRIKVVDTGSNPGKILAAAQRIRPLSQDEDDGRRSLFKVRTADLGPETWKVNIDVESGPILLLNNRITGFPGRIVSSPFLQGAILPSALRVVLQHVAEQWSNEDEDGSWYADWLQFCSALGIPDAPARTATPEDKEVWVDDVVSRFCARSGFVDRIRGMIETKDSVHG